MPAKSKAQQRFMGMVHAVQKGDMDAPSSEVEKAADSMSDADAKDYASTKHKGLPNHVKKENMEKELKEIIRQTYRESLRESVNEAKIQPKDDWGVRLVVAINNNVAALHTSVIREKKDVQQAVAAFGNVLKNAIKETLKHKYKPHPKYTEADSKIKTFISELKKFENIVDMVISKPTKSGIVKLDDAWRSIWNHKFGSAIALSGDLFNSIIENESVNEAKYPTNLYVGSVIYGQGFTGLKGIEGGKYYKVVEMDDYSATLVPCDEKGKITGSKKVRHKLDSIEGGIKTAKRGDENGIVIESVNESISHEAMGIASMTNTRKEAVQKFIDDNNLNAKEILTHVTKGKLPERIRFVQALVGTPNNSSFKWYVKNYANESVVNEAIDINHWKKYANGGGPLFSRKVKTQREFNTEFREVAYAYNNDPDSRENRLKRDKIEKVKKLAQEFFDKEGFITSNIIDEMWSAMVSGKIKEGKVTEGKKAFKINPPIGSSKYSISAYDGITKHKDGSPFYNILIFKNKADLERRANYFRSEKYIEEAVVTEGKKAFRINPQIGKAKYSISAHNGVSKHKDGSDFWDILIFKNKADLERRAKYFRGEKYIEEAVVTEGRYDADLDKIEAVVKNATSFMNVGSELKKAGIKYDFTTSMIPMYMIKVSGNTIAICNKKYAAGAEREVNDIAIGLLN